MSYRHLLLMAVTCQLALFSTDKTYCGEIYTQKVTVVDGSGYTGSLVVYSGKGDISIVGYSGKEVVIKAESDGKMPLRPIDNEKAKGLKRITGTGFNVSYNESENVVIITRPPESSTKLDLKVPHDMDIKIGTAQLQMIVGNYQNSIQVTQKIQMNTGVSLPGMLRQHGGVFEGNVTVSDMDGSMELNTVDGNIVVNNVTGAVIANSMDGDITVTYTGKLDEQPMAFSTVEGDVDITLPEKITATVMANNMDGDVYTDFDLNLLPAGVEKIPADVFSGGKDTIIGRFGAKVSGKINGGGPQVRMSSVSGNIYIRKGKQANF